MTGNPLTSVPHSFAVYIRHVQTLQLRAYQKHRRARMGTTPPHMYVCHLPLTQAWCSHSYIINRYLLPWNGRGSMLCIAELNVGGAGGGGGVVSNRHRSHIILYIWLLLFLLTLTLLLLGNSAPHSLNLLCLITATWKHALLLILHIQQYSELPSAYLLEENHYWLPAATLSGIKAQIHQKAAHSLELQPESITLLEELGKGEFGMVYKGEWTSSPGGPVQVAVKTLHSQEEENRYKLLKEAAIMGQFSHPNVVRLYGVVDKPNKVK